MLSDRLISLSESLQVPACCRLVCDGRTGERSVASGPHWYPLPCGDLGVAPPPGCCDACCEEMGGQAAPGETLLPPPLGENPGFRTSGGLLQPQGDAGALSMEPGSSWAKEMTGSAKENRAKGNPRVPTACVTDGSEHDAPLSECRGRFDGERERKSRSPHLEGSSQETSVPAAFNTFSVRPL